MKKWFWKRVIRPHFVKILGASYEASIIDSWTWHALMGAADEPRSRLEIYRFFQLHKNLREKAK